ncbi:MAG: PDZ domain-containing protein [Gemmatimonadetes bacterium]|nr:PDZ domain-containing protein [Gemmatimonadota bacterium]
MYPRRWIVPAALLGLWGLWGLADDSRTPNGGFDWGTSAGVLAVEPGGPADRAGLREGDRILSMDGVPVTDLTALRRQPRTEIGETRVLVVERTDAATGATTPESIGIAYSGLPFRDRTVNVVAGLIGFAFLLSGLTVFLKTQSTPALLFALVGLGFSAMLLPSPYIGTYGLRIATETVFFLAFLTGFACLLHLLLVFPKRKKVMEKRLIAWMIYLPIPVFVLMGIVNFVVVDWRVGSLRAPAAMLLGLILLGYVLLSLTALVHSFVTAGPGERAAEGLNLMLWGVVVGLLPLTAMVVAGMFGIRTDLLPGSDWMFLPLILIPISFAAALLKTARSSGAAAVTP